MFNQSQNLDKILYFIIKLINKKVYKDVLTCEPAKAFRLAIETIISGTSGFFVEVKQKCQTFPGKQVTIEAKHKQVRKLRSFRDLASIKATHIPLHCDSK